MEDNINCFTIRLAIEFYLDDGGSLMTMELNRGFGLEVSKSSKSTCETKGRGQLNMDNVGFFQRSLLQVGSAKQTKRIILCTSQVLLNHYKIIF